MNVFITGVTGFLGGHLSKAFRKNGDEVTGMIHDGHSGMSRDLDHWTFGDMKDIGSIERVLSEYEIETVIHLAAQCQTTVAFNDPLGTFKTNVEGTWNLLEACRRQKIDRVVVASTDKAYGEHRDRCNESFSLDGCGPYETSKVCVDILSQMYAHRYDMSIGVTRCANLYGPEHKNFSTLIPGTIKRVICGERPKIYNGGESIREFLYIDDAVDAYLAMARSRFIGPMNFGGGEFFQVKDVVLKIIEEMKSDLIPEEVSNRGNEIKEQRLDSYLAKSVLGWTPKVTFNEGIKKTVKWYRDTFEGMASNAFAVC